MLAISSMWLLADAVGFWRLLLLMVTAIVAMVVWIIIAHHLWERPEDRAARVGVALQRGYSADDKRSGAVGLRHPVRPALCCGVGVRAWQLLPEYPQAPYRVRRVPDSKLVGGFAGHGGRSLGSQPEDEERVRAASYGYRQRRRHEDDDDDPEDES